jgi:IMP dehydrogenase/GMP reductase
MNRRDFMLQTAATFFSAATTPRIFKPSKTNKMENPIFKTALCDLLKIKYPILQAGMADVATPELAAAVSNAGGLGIITATMMTPDIVRSNIRKIKSFTNNMY